MAGPILWDASLCQQVGWVLLSQNFVQIQVVVADPLLDPHDLDIQVPNFAQALSATHSNASNAIRPDPYWPIEAKIGHQ